MNDTLADLKLLANENAAYADILKYVNILNPRQFDPEGSEWSK